MSTADVQTEPAVAALLAAGWVRETEQAAPTAWADAAPAVLRAFRGLRSSDDAVWFLPAAGSAFRMGRVPRPQPGRRGDRR